jgi:hypothetical protein
MTAQLFAEAGVRLSEVLIRQMHDQFKFYYLTVPVTLMPRRGVQFTRVECRLNFGPKGSREPIIQSIAPQRQWREVLEWGGAMKLKIDGKLDFSVDLEVPAPAIALPGAIKAHLAAQNDAQARIIVPDYSFKIGRAEITATGEGNSECFWRIESPQLREEQTVKFSVIFKVPRDVDRVELAGLVIASPDMNWLGANLRDVYEFLSDNLKALFRPNSEVQLGVGDHEKWVLALPD